jgi:hypothetical protein
VLALAFGFAVGCGGATAEEEEEGFSPSPLIQRKLDQTLQWDTIFRLGDLIVYPNDLFATYSHSYPNARSGREIEGGSWLVIAVDSGPSWNLGDLIARTDFNETLHDPIDGFDYDERAGWTDHIYFDSSGVYGNGPLENVDADYLIEVTARDSAGEITQVYKWAQTEDSTEPRPEHTLFTGGSGMTYRYCPEDEELENNGSEARWCSFRCEVPTAATQPNYYPVCDLSEM